MNSIAIGVVMSLRPRFGPLSGVTVLKARWVVGYDEGHHVLLPDGEVAVEHDRIIFLGNKAPMPVARKIDFGNALIGPGFIDLDALSDLDSTILAFDNQPEERTGRVWPRDYYEAGPIEMYTLEDLTFQKRYAFAQLLKNGVTTAAPIASIFYRKWAETTAEFEGAATVAADLGIRVYLGPAYSSGLALVEPDGRVSMHFDEEKGRAGLEDALNYARRWDGAYNGLVRTMLAPNRIETCTPELLRRTAEAAAELNCPIRLHACQSNFEIETVRRLRGKDPIDWLDELRLLTPQLMIPHLTHLPSNENNGSLHRLAEAGVSLVHCPLVAARYGFALSSFAKYKAAGLNIAMGTDTWPPDMLYNMQLALLLGRVADHDATAVSAKHVYDAATLGGAKALGRNDLGRLDVGARADLTVFELDRDDLGQLIDPIQTMMIAGSGAGFSHVMVNGRFSVINKSVQNFNLKVAHGRAQRQFDRLVSLYPMRTHAHPPIGRIFISSYPVIGSNDQTAPWQRPG